MMMACVKVSVQDFEPDIIKMMYWQTVVDIEPTARIWPVEVISL